jgi:S-formylglutathione hydrolase
MSELTQIASIKTGGGFLNRYQHDSESLNCRMTFAVFLPPAAENSKVSALWWLSGLTCTDENFSQKAGAFNKAAELGLAIILPDTSPRGLELPGEHDSYDFGSGAGFYLNATQSPWNQHYRMYDYLVHELPTIIAEQFPISDRQSISGHSMGGHGALTIALKNPERFQSVSAFAPIVNPMQCPWGEKAFTHYLGEDRTTWAAYDSCELLKSGARLKDIFIDQGGSDNFLNEQLKPENLEKVCAEVKQPLTLRRHEGYDHSYYFISTFIEEHLEYHSRHLTKAE